MNTQENHPFLNGLNIASGATASLTGWWTLAYIGDPEYTGICVLVLALAILLFCGVVWLSKTSDNFHKWSQLSGGQQLLGYLIVLPGLMLGIFIIVALAALKVELGRNRD